MKAGYCLAVCLLGVLATLSHGQTPSLPSLAEPHHEAMLPALRDPGFQDWNNGYLVTRAFEGTPYVSPSRPALRLYDRSGRLVREIIVWFEDAVRVSLADAVVTPDGKVIVSGGMSNSVGAVSNFIAEVDGAGRIARMIRTEPFVARHVCAGDDGTVWSYGFDRNVPEAGASTFLLRQYSFDKGPLRSMLDRASLDFAVWRLVDGNYPGEVRLFCAPGKVGLLNWKSQQYFEFDVLTAALKSVRIAPLLAPQETNDPHPQRITGSAMTQTGDVFVSLTIHIEKAAPPTWGVYKLRYQQTSGATWIPVAGSVGTQAAGMRPRVLGADGNDLVYMRDMTLGTSAFWSTVTLK